jgi:hypothetical protein
MNAPLIAVLSSLAMLLIVPCALAAAEPAAADPLAGRSPYGGCLEIKGTATGFFHTEKLNDRWMLVDPDGCGFLLIGMSGIGYYPSDDAGRGGRRWGWDRVESDEVAEMRRVLREKYPTRADWATAQIGRLRDWGFNGLLGRREDDVPNPIPYVVLLSMGGGWRAELFKDVFSEAFEQRVLEAAERCSPLKDDPWLIGYFTDNELPWRYSWGGGMLDEYLSHPADAPGAAAAVKFLEDRYDGDVAAFNAAWATRYDAFQDMLTDTAVRPGPGFDKHRVTQDREDFLHLVSRRYHSLTYRAVKDADPNHMVMGTRFLTGDISPAVIRGMNGSVDVISTNSYLTRNYPDSMFASFSELAGAPLLLTEFGYSAKDSGVPMDHTGAIPRVVDTQQERADKYAWYVGHVVTRPYLIGAIWWQYMDGFQGRYAGNFGLVTWGDEPYRTLTDRMTEVNLSLYDRLLHDPGTSEPVPPDHYTIRRTEPLDLDGDIAKYGELDIRVDRRHRYEGFEFDSVDFAADAALRHDDDDLYLAVRVRDADVFTCTSEELAAEDLNVWELDGVEFWVGYYQWLLHFEGDAPTLTPVRSDPFPGVRTHVTMLDDGYFYEAAFPKRELVDAISDGAIRFALGVNDGRLGERFRQIYYPRSYEWQYEETFAVGELTD